MRPPRSPRRPRRVPRATAEPVRLGAIDIGTNSVRLVVAEVETDGSYRVLDEEREMARLGYRLAETGRLDRAAMARARAALSRMKAIADGFGVAELRAVATSAVREAANGLAFCREVRRRAGLRVDIISPEEEARLALASARRQFDLAGRRAAVVDIGGGSLEVVFAAGGVAERIESLPLGAVKLTERYAHSDPLRRRDWKRLRRAIDRALERQLVKPPFRPEVIVGSGGTFTNLADMDRAERGGGNGEQGGAHGYALTRGQVVQLVKRLRLAPLAARREMPGLNPRRADIIVAGAAAVARVATRLGCNQIVVNERGLRDGLLLAMIGERAEGAGQPQRPTDRFAGVRAFARACRTNERHCEHVARLADRVFEQLRERWELPPEAGELLRAAALLHDVGRLINHARRHKHAYHLIMHANLEGFTAREVELIANIARYHRKGRPRRAHANFARLPGPDRTLVRALAGMVRLACGLDRTHTQRVTDVRCEAGPGRLRLVLAAAADPQVERWEAARKGTLLERALRVRLAVAWEGKTEAARTPRAPRLVRAAG